MYNISNNVLRKVASVKEDGAVSTWASPNPELHLDSLYICNRHIYVWDGKKMILTSDSIQQAHSYGYTFLADNNNTLEALSTESGYLGLHGGISDNATWKTKKYDIEGLPFVFATGQQTSVGLFAVLLDSDENVLKKIILDTNGVLINEYIYCCDGAKYLKVCSQKEISVCKPFLQGSVIKLFGSDKRWQNISETGWKVGFVMYNPESKTLRRCVRTNGTGGVLEFDTLPFSNSSIYILNGELYYYNGIELQSFNVLTINTLDKTLIEISASLYGNELGRIEAEDSVGYISKDGTIETTNKYWKTYKYDISDFDLVYVTGKSSSVGAVCALYDKNDNCIKTFDFGISGYAVTNKPYIVRGAKFIRVSHFSKEGSPNLRKIKSISEQSLLRNNLLGKVVAFIGDSITAGGSETAPKDKLYHRVFAEKYGCTNRNLGVWSTCIANNTKNDLSADRFVTRATSENLSDCALIVVFGGTNDFTCDSKPIGDLFVEETQTPASSYMGDKKIIAPTDTDTFAGALHELINTIRNVAPNVPMVFITPLLKDRSNVSSRQVNANGDSTRDFAESIIKICAFYSIPVLDAAANSQLDFTNAAIANYYSSDGLHPNVAGHKLLGELLFRFVEDNVVIL